ncbi:DNA/RNA polymerase [Coemansia reversa NRRL 1564]|uniref:DNA/RNA polymerase n=1 Tax=Coemansia reversa (strain ATCC 12441 / NRRL 1564) TaxID=763665 RepID=A0A2G5B229_COERN|nr:DNA/RNA polymerase [Coemansia reversa NRRL 1564]|eukprot:PIA12767.1 DNA/RNA polymerase [Coemansia reversa NRRL 1564]
MQMHAGIKSNPPSAPASIVFSNTELAAASKNFREFVKLFTADFDGPSPHDWMQHALSKLQLYLPDAPEEHKAQLLIEKIKSSASTSVRFVKTIEKVRQALYRHHPDKEWGAKYERLIEQGTLYANVGPEQARHRAEMATHYIGLTSSVTEKIMLHLGKVYDEAIFRTGLPFPSRLLANVSTLDFYSVLDEFFELVDQVEEAKTIPKLGLALCPVPVLESPANTEEPVIASDQRMTTPQQLAVDPAHLALPKAVASETGSDVKYSKVCRQVENHDDDWNACDTLYPAVNRENVDAHMHTGQVTPEIRSKLLEEIMTAATALCEYPSGCPPPAAIHPIIIPMKPDAVLLYVPSYSRSEADKIAMEKYVSCRLTYRIDEPGYVTANIPVFSVAKPDTDERHILMDDSIGSTINMTKIGMRLPRYVDVHRFVSNAKMISGVDLMSFFTCIRLVPEQRDFWTYEGGSSAGRVRTTCLVQGNSKSPMIAQAFLMKMFADMLELDGKLLGYIDNIYLKTTKNDVYSHIKEVGILLCTLAHWNVLANLSKAEFLMTKNLNILGYWWSAGGTWKVPDDRIATLQNLPMPTAGKALRRLCGGVQAISQHVPGSSLLLAPFHALSGKKGSLTLIEHQELEPHWKNLKRTLLNTAHLYKPEPAWGLIRAVENFYTYLDRCTNLSIEVDATTSLGLFGHKGKCPVDELSNLRSQLAAMGQNEDVSEEEVDNDERTADCEDDWLH